MFVDLFTVFAQIVNFGVLVLLLRRFLYRPILHKMEQRQAEIKDQQEETERLKADARALLAAAKGELEEIEEVRAVKLEKIGQEVRARREGMIQELRVDTNEAREAAKRDLARDAKRRVEELRNEIGQQMLLICRRALGDLAGVDFDQRALGLLIRQLEQQSADRSSQRRWTDSESFSVVSAHALGEEDRIRLRNALGMFAAGGGGGSGGAGDPKVEFQVSSALIGGLEIRAADQKLAWSIGSFIEDLGETFRKQVQSAV